MQANQKQKKKNENVHRIKFPCETSSIINLQRSKKERKRMHTFKNGMVCEVLTTNRTEIKSGRKCYEVNEKQTLKINGYHFFSFIHFEK